MLEGVSAISRRFLEDIKEKIFVVDGAMGTMLAGALTPGEPPEILNLRNPDVVADVHQQYAEAGADIIETNTFGANRVKLQKYGLEQMVSEINYKGVSITKENCPNTYVWASMGPTGELLEPFGILTFKECYEVFAEQARYFKEAGADAVSIETMTDLQEMKAAVLAVKDTTDLPVIAHMTFMNSDRTLMGNDIESVAVVLEALGVDLLGANCSLGPSELLGVIKRMSYVTTLPLSVEPNAGIPVNEQGRTVFPLGPEDFSKFVEDFVNSGVCVIGGCCGTTPQYIKEIKKRISGLHPIIRNSQDLLKLSTGRNSVILSEEEQNLFVSDVFVLDESNGAEFEDWARQQLDVGAQVIRVSKGVVDTGIFVDIVKNLQLYVNISIAIECFEGIDDILQYIKGKPWLCLQATSENLGEAFTIAKKCGAGVIVSTLRDGTGCMDAEHVLVCAGAILEQARKHGLSFNDLVFDVHVHEADVAEITDLELIKANDMLWTQYHVRTTLPV